MLDFDDEEQMLYMDKTISESLDVAFLVANYTLPYYGPLKIEEMFQHIFPTAFVLGYAPWPFYKNKINGEFICICRKYGMVCVHKPCPKDIHCIDTIMTYKQSKDNFRTLASGPVSPTKYYVQYMLSPPTMPPGCLLSIRVEVKNKRIASYVPKTRHRTPNEDFRMNIRLNMLPELRPIPRYVFPPNPDLKKNIDDVLIQKEGIEHHRYDAVANGWAMPSERIAFTLCPSTMKLDRRNLVKWDDSQAREMEDLSPTHFVRREFSSDYFEVDEEKLQKIEEYRGKMAIIEEYLVEHKKNQNRQ